MKHLFVNILGILSIILLSCTLLCGVWVATHEGSDISFHAIFSSVCIVIAILSQLVNLCKCKFCKKN